MTNQDKTPSSVTCPICSAVLSEFQPYGVIPRPGALCPICGSLERHRLLWLFLKERTSLFSERLKVLDIAPTKGLSEKMKAMPNIEYMSVDINSELAMRHMDITSMDFSDNLFDCIICYHVLEHIPDDRKAMQELFRVLKPGGWAILQVPLDSKLENTVEGTNIIDPKRRKLLFGQEDHLRLYGRDYKDRLEQAGFRVVIDNFIQSLSSEEISKYRLMQNENIYFCSKPGEGIEKHINNKGVILKKNYICHLVYEHDFIQLFNDMIADSCDIQEHVFIVYAKIAWDDSKEYNLKNSYYIESFDDNYFMELIENSTQIIVHCLYTPELTNFLFQNQHLLHKVNWKLWGGDLYLYRQIGSVSNSESNEEKRKNIIKDIAYITSPVEEEYKRALNVYGGNALYKFAFYPLPKDFSDYKLVNNQREDQTINIFLGNSGYQTNNHLQAFSFLSRFRNEQIKIYCPLSYGDKQYTKEVCEKGAQIFGDKFVPLSDFIQFDEYINLLNDMDIIIMNHDRQQGVGNILMSLYLGKKVYLQPDITTYKCLSRFGVTIYNINEIEKIAFNDLVTFSNDIGKINSEIIKAKYSKENCIKSWQAIFNEAINLKKESIRKFFLINFHYKDFYSDTIRNPSLGPAFILQHLSDNGVVTKLHELSFNDDVNYLLKEIKDFGPHLIGCSFMTYHYQKTYGYIEALKTLSIPIVCGGAHINSKGAKVLEEANVDFLIKGEGEKSLLSLLYNINNPEAFSDIPGLIYRKNSVVIENSAKIVDVDSLGFPKYKNFALDKYADGRILIQTSRGCPYQCTFCQQASLLGKKWRARSPQNIVNELEYWGSLGKTSLVFSDDNLTLDKKRIQKICELIQKSKYRFHIETAGVRIDNVDYETLKIMKDVGFYYLSFGIESGSDRVLKEIRKGITLSQIHKTLEMSSKLNFEIKLYFIINNRTETYEEAQQSFILSRQYPISLARFTNLCPFPGTYDYEWILKHGRLLYPPEEYLNNPNDFINRPIYDGPGMSIEEREQIIKDAEIELARHKKSMSNISKDRSMSQNSTEISSGCINNDNIKKASSPQRILFINHSIYPFEISGTPLSTLNHVLGMARQGLEVAALIPNTGIKEGWKKEKAKGFTLYQVPAMDKLAAYFLSPEKEVIAGFRHSIEQIIADFSPQIVHINDYVYMPAQIIELFYNKGCIIVRNVCNCEELCHQDYPVLSSGLDGRLCSGPESPHKCADCFITLLKNKTGREVSPELIQSVNKSINHRFEQVQTIYLEMVDKVIFTSEAFRNYFTRFMSIPAERIKMIPRGFNFSFSRINQRKKSSDGIIHFAFIGNIMFSKGIDIALRAFKRINKTQKFVLHIYGQIVNPEYLTEIKKLESQNKDRFIYHGGFETKDIPQIASLIDVCIIPSYFDTYNRVIREFMYMGVPVIATDFFGAYIVKDGENGFRIPVGDANALAEKMVNIIQNPNIVEELACGAAQTYIPSLDEECNMLIETYNSLYKPSLETIKVKLNKKITTDINQKTFADGKPLLLSFYLPQFHPIPENDEWWGKGFTEWMNVTKAKPLFPEHYQPHLPADLGFYDLRLPEVRKAQAELARRYGIYGFCYYHYWFSGKQLLQQIFDDVLSSGEPDFPFCLCWANENWTRVWDGGDKKILMQQNYSQEDDLAHIAWLIKAFKDPRYIKVKGMPLLLIYRASELPDPAKTALLWREEVKKAGFPDLYLCKVESFSNEHTDIYDIGFDAAVEFQPDWSRLGGETERHHDLHIFNYSNIVKNMIEKPQPEYIRFPCVTPSWDNTPRRGTDGTIFHNLRPTLYEKWLRHAISRVGGNTPDERIVFINAWNEWAEGNHLEPDQRYGHAFLHATRRAITIDNERAKLNERLTNRAAIFLESGRLDEAKRLLMEALSYDSSEPRTLHQYAILLFQQGNLSESCKTLIRALETDPWNAEFHNDLGAIYYSAHEISKAQGHFEKALEINPQDITSLKNLTELLINKEQFEDALDTCNRLNSLAPDDEEVINLRSIIYDKITFEDSVDFSNKALDVSIGTININKELKDTDKQLWPLPENASLQNSIFHKTLLIEQPKFHNDGQGNPISWNTNGRLLNFLDEYLQPGMHTLETGSGYSTVLFIGKKCIHTAVTPAEVEFNRISNYCKKHNLPLDHARFVARDSADHLPLMNENNLDVLFIDGAHRFPFPIIDWFYGSKFLKQGGIAIVDDTDIISCFILRSFLERDDHWETVLIEKDFSVFRKLAGHDYPGDWPGQVFSKKKIQDAETFLKVFFDAQDNSSASRSGALKTPEIRPHYSASLAPQKPLKEPETIMTSPHSVPTNAEKPDVGTTKNIAVDWTPAFDYQTLTAEEIEEYSNIEVTEDLREGGIHAQKAWDYWFKYLSTNIWKTSLSAEIVSFCNTIDHPRILSLGCGYGGVELGIARQLNKSFQITAVDLNGQLFTRAIQEARANGFDIRFMALDLNYVKIHENSFDLIFAHASLHHLLNLEHVFLQIHRGLSENGRLIVQDIVGKTQVLFWKDNVDHAIEIVRQMPTRYKAGIPNKQAIIAPYVEPTTQKGMEGIRQEEIPALLESFFAPVKVFPYGAFMRLICTHPELGKRLDPDRTLDRKYLEQIFKIDLQLIAQNKLRATEMLGVYQKRSAIDINGINSRAYMRLGELLVQQGKASHAFEHFKRAAIIDSGGSSESHTFGIENGESDQLQQNDSHSVLKASHDILAQSPGNTETLLALGQEYLSRGDLDEAEQHLQAAVTQSPNEPRILHQYGLLLFQRGKVTKSIANLILALEVDPYNAEFHNDLGAMYHASGDIAKAQEYFEKALEIKPDDITSLKNLTELYVAKEQLDDARNTCDKLKSAYPDDQEACNLWKLIKIMQGQAASKGYSSEAVGLAKKNSFRDNPATGGSGRNIIQDENHFTQDNKQNSTCLLSIVMIVKNDLEGTDLKIRSIIEHVQRDDIEFIVVDNGSHDGTIDYLRNLRNEKISVILLEKEVTFAQGGTLGAEKASGAFIMFLDNSVVITKPLLQSIMKILTNSPDLDAVVGKTVTKGKTIVEAGATTIGKSGLKSRGEGSPLYDPAYNFTCEVKSGSRHCMIMRRDVWEKVEGFNNDLEDIGAALIDLGMKITSIGYRILYQPQCILFYENPVAQHSIGKDIALPDLEALASLRPKDLPIDLMNIINNPGHKNILVLGIYLANKMNTIHDVVTVFHGSSNHSVVQKWVALNGSPPDVETEAVTVKVLTGRVPKFQIINELLYEENLSNYDYIILCDDDVVLPKNFVDSFIAIQSKLEFAIAQPARTINSYIDHPIVQQHIGVYARQTHFVEIGPVVSFHRSAYDFIFPFDLTSSMGWGYENAWAHEAIQRNLKMGIIDGVCVDHSLREPVANYQWDQADKERTEYLNKNNHLPLEECFRVLNAHIISETST